MRRRKKKREIEENIKLSKYQREPKTKTKTTTTKKNTHTHTHLESTNTFTKGEHSHRLREEKERLRLFCLSPLFSFFFFCAVRLLYWSRREVIFLRSQEIKSSRSDSGFWHPQRKVVCMRRAFATQDTPTTLSPTSAPSSLRLRAPLPFRDRLSCV